MAPHIIGYPPLRIGIIGGGQLAKMMAQAAKTLGFSVAVLDPVPDCPAAGVADRHVVGGFHDAERLTELVTQCDVTTYDLEHIDADTLAKLSANHVIHPSPAVLAMIQDKVRQKEMLLAAGIPTPEFRPVTRLEDDLAFFSFPVVQKVRRGGYDGHGVRILKTPDDLKHALEGETFLEAHVDIARELAVMVARDKAGKISCYPVVDLYFDARRPVCSTVIAPAQVSAEVAKEAQRIAIACTEAIEGVGIFGIEMFLTKDNRVLVNEIAPRPHNSGHYTAEGCVTSQFEQHIRAITGLPLGSGDLLAPTVMVNILGEEGQHGEAVLDGVAEALAIDGLSLHWYGKREIKSLRKMGHITVIDPAQDKAIVKAQKAMSVLKARAK